MPEGGPRTRQRREEEQAAAPVTSVVPAHLDLEHSGPRAREIIRALKSGTFEGVTYPEGRGMVEFFSKFSESEMQYLTQAWAAASEAERTLFKDMLTHFFEYAGSGRRGMETLLAIMKRMAEESARGLGQVSLIDVFYYANDVMAGERVRGGGRASEIGSIGSYLERKIGRRYDRLTASREERPAEVPEAGAEVSAEARAALATRPVRTTLDQIRTDYMVVQNTRGVLEEEELSESEAASIRSSMAGIEDRILANIESLGPEERAQVEWIRADILRRRGAAPPAAAATAEVPVEEAPAEEAPAAPPVAEAAPGEVTATLVDWSNPGLASIPDERKLIYEELISRLREFGMRVTDPVPIVATLERVASGASPAGTMDANQNPERRRRDIQMLNQIFTMVGLQLNARETWAGDMFRIAIVRRRGAAPVPQEELPVVAEPAAPVEEAPAETAAPPAETAPAEAASAETVTYDIPWLRAQLAEVNRLAEGRAQRKDPAILQTPNGAEIERIYRDVLAHIGEITPANPADRTFMQRFRVEIETALGMV